MTDNKEKEQIIEMPVRIMRGSILVTDEFCNLFQDLSDKINIIITDDDGNKYPCLLNTKTHHLFNMEVWLRKYKPKADDAIIFLPSQPQNPKSIKITLKSHYFTLQDLTKKREGPGEIISPTEVSDLLYLGKEINLGYYKKDLSDKKFYLSPSDLIRHIFICGIQGAGKTVFGKGVIEEAALRGIPSIVIDLKGDLSSLALVFPNLCGEEFQPWIDIRKGQDPIRKAILEADKHKKHLEYFGISERELKEYKEKVIVNVFTLKSNRGLKLGVSPFTELPENVSKIKDEDPDVYIQMIDLLTENFVSRLDIRDKNKAKKAKGYLFELIKYALEKQINLQGYLGLINLIKFIEDTPEEISFIEARQIDSYISKKEREDLANLINNLLVGASRLWFDGPPLNLDEMLEISGEKQKTPINIINLSELDSEDIFSAISYVATSIFFWMRRKGGAGLEPRLIFYIDEIGKGGGKDAIFPSHPYYTPSKPALNQLLRQGRTYGVCCIFATQNPGDIDYKGLSNCATWVVGKLSTGRDIEKIKQGASIAEISFDIVEGYIPGLDTGELVIRTLKGEWLCFKERWLYSYHTTLSYEQLGKIKEEYEKQASKLFLEAEQLFNSNSYRDAIDIYKKVIRNFKYYSKVELARLRIGIALYKMREFDDSIKVLEDAATKCYNSTIVSEAQFYLAKCYKEKSNYLKAKDCFENAKAASKDINLIKQSEVLMDYCEKIIKWPALSMLKKLKIWFLSIFKPGAQKKSVAQVDLEKEDEVLEQEITSIQLDFKLPQIPDEIKIEELRWQEVKKELEEEYQVIRTRTYPDVQRAKSLMESKEFVEAKKIYEKVIEKYINKGLYVDLELQEQIRILNKRIKEQRDKRRKLLATLDPFIFEVQIAKLYGSMGFSVINTPRTGDQGVDFFAIKDDKKYIVQCKHWVKPVGEPVLRDLLGTKIHFKADYAILVTTSDFTEQAIRFANSHDIELIDSEKLITMILSF
jgi:tetratricopeptide (TPR) repeat protein